MIHSHASGASPDEAVSARSPIVSDTGPRFWFSTDHFLILLYPDKFFLKLKTGVIAILGVSGAAEAEFHGGLPGERSGAYH
jgi:hypothetical protein